MAKTMRKQKKKSKTLTSAEYPLANGFKHSNRLKQLNIHSNWDCALPCPIPANTQKIVIFNFKHYLTQYFIVFKLNYTREKCGPHSHMESLEDLMIELRKKGVTIPPEVINDLKSAKLMIKISERKAAEEKHHRKLKSTLEALNHA